MNNDDERDYAEERANAAEMRAEQEWEAARGDAVSDVADHAGHGRLIEVLAACPYCPPRLERAPGRRDYGSPHPTCHETTSIGDPRPTYVCGEDCPRARTCDGCGGKITPHGFHDDGNTRCPVFPGGPPPRTPAPCSFSPPAPFPADSSGAVTERDR